MKTSCVKTSRILLSLILAMGFVATGCKKETPPPQELTAKEKQFLSAPNATICKLEKIKISKMDIPKGNMASSIIRYMDQNNRHYVKQGQITLANRPFKIILGFHPEREFYVYDIEKGFGPFWLGSRSLHSYHKIDDKLYEFMLIEDGTKIAARPYKGPFGTIMVGKGGRELEKVEFSGSLKKEDYVAVPVGAIIKENWPDMVTECEIPVGDYTTYAMYVTYDNLYINISNNQYPNTQGRSSRKDIVYSMQVREDKPYVLDFSNKPMVIFDQPSMSQTSFSRGQEIKFAAVLIDPKLDIMIRGLNDTSVKVDKEYKDAEGKVIRTMKVDKSLDPNVVIARADGEVIAKGVMPFG